MLEQVVSRVCNFTLFFVAYILCLFRHLVCLPVQVAYRSLPRNLWLMSSPGYPYKSKVLKFVVC